MYNIYVTFLKLYIFETHNVLYKYIINIKLIFYFLGERGLPGPDGPPGTKGNSDSKSFLLLTLDSIVVDLLFIFNRKLCRFLHVLLTYIVRIILYSAFKYIFD